jgi:hypothetical protein
MTVLPNLQQEIETLRQANAALMAKLAIANKPKAITMKVGEKGGLSVYGLGRFPITLYRSQWERLIGCTDQIKDFIEANTDLLASKD